MATKKKALPVTQTITRMFKKGRRITKDDGESETLDVLVFETDEVSHLTVKLGLTLNRGNFESVKVDVSTTIPHYEEEKDDAFLYALKETERRLPAVVGDENAVSDMFETAKEAMKNG